MNPLAEPKQQLSETIRQHFLDQGYRPGDQIEPELTLADRFGVSRSKTREVLTTMCHQGILERKPRAGTVIRQLDPDQLGENLQFRFLLEGLEEADAFEARRVIESAILPLIIRRITPSQIASLDALIQEMESNLDKGQRADEADRRFHLELLKCCGNRTLMIFSGVINGMFKPVRRDRYKRKELLSRAASEHRALLVAIKNEDLQRALKILEEHYSHFEEEPTA